MILRRITQHVKEQNWFAVGLDFIIVVAGILIAFQITNWNEDQSARAKLTRVEEVLQNDLINTYFSAKGRLALVECRRQVYQSIAVKLLEPGEAWVGIPRSDANNVANSVLPMLLRSPHGVTWGSPTWKAELAQGTFNQMDDERRAALDGIFRQAELADTLQSDILELQGQLKVLAISTDIPKSDRLRYYEKLGELDDKSGTLEFFAELLTATIETIGVKVPVDQQEQVNEFLRSGIAIRREIYGACYVIPTFPAFDWLPEEGATP